jgi:hypothetical protein
MKARTAFIALALFSAQASAEWELIGESNAGMFFIDPATIRKQGGYTYVWGMEDFLVEQSVDGKKYKSTKTLAAFKCYERQSGWKYIIAYSNNMGAGSIVLSPQREAYEIKFLDIVPDSVGALTYKIVCGE